MNLEIAQNIEKFKDVRSKLMDMLEVFPENKIDLALFDDQTIKQLALNITLAEMFTIAFLEDLREGRDLVWEDPYEYVDPLVHPDSDWDDLFQDLLMSGESFIQTLELFPEHLWDNKIWTNKDLTPKKILSIDTSHYENFYLAEIIKHIDEEYIY
jgi:hypothetical protein